MQTSSRAGIRRVESLNAELRLSGTDRLPAANPDYEFQECITPSPSRCIRCCLQGKQLVEVEVANSEHYLQQLQLAAHSFQALPKSLSASRVLGLQSDQSSGSSHTTIKVPGHRRRS